MTDLREQSGGSRITLRMDIPEHNCEVDRVTAKSLAPGNPSLGPDTSLNLRARYVSTYAEHRGRFVQPDTDNAAVQPPEAFMQAYGVKAEMLIPLVAVKDALAWTSVYFVPNTRKWSEGDVAALHEAARKVSDILRGSGWATATVNQEV